MAGATQTGDFVARYNVLNRSSAKPAANLANVSQLAGATNNKSAQRANSICPIPASASGFSNSVCTGFPDKAWKVKGVIKACAPSVITTRTLKPASFKRRTKMALLYAAIPPVTANTIFLFGITLKSKLTNKLPSCCSGAHNIIK